MKVYWITGGIGKNVIAAAAMRHIAICTSKDIGILTGWPEVWENMAFIKSVVHPEANGMEAAIQLHEGRIVERPEPYLNLGYRTGKTHLMNAFLEELGFVGVDVDSQPKAYVEVTQEEEGWAKKWLDRFLKENRNIGKIPVMFQPFGLMPQEGQRRSLPPDVAQHIVDILTDKGYVVIQSRGQTDRKLLRTYAPDLRLRHMIALVSAFDYVISADTWLVHVAAATGKKALVFYGATDPAVLGYEQHINVEKSCKLGRCMRPDIALPDNFVCPFQGDCLKYDSNRIEEVLGRYLEWRS